jgi:hypothetical protein
VFAFAHNLITLSSGDIFRITFTYTASNETLRTMALKNGIAFGPLAEVSLAGKPDFRVDSFAVISYSDAIQSGLPAFHGSVLAHGTVDNVTLVVPSPPAGNLRLGRNDSTWHVELESLTNWSYTLERSSTLRDWSGSSAATPGNGGRLRLIDFNNPVAVMFYRVRAERP